MDEKRSIILDYEQLLLKRNATKVSVNYFRHADTRNEELALFMFHYAFENILHWDPVDVVNGASKDLINVLRLVLPYSSVKFPRELKSNKDYFYLAQKLYPHLQTYDIRHLVELTYKNVIGKKEGKFPKEYFVEKEGDIRACICLQYVLQHYFSFRDSKEMYDTFADEKQANALLSEYKLLKACRMLYKTPLDYLHATVPNRQKDNLYYAQLKLKHNLETIKKTKSLHELYESIPLD